MPVNFLTEDQRGRWGRFNEVPDLTQLGGFFHLEAADRRRAMAANGARNQLGYAVQLGTARFLNCFLTEPIPRTCPPWWSTTSPSNSAWTPPR
ncbi:DUF4158 domain-containing protein [Streptosporangium sp. NPDC000396]|uniref:DUF4158 domain-containing protein n=1 Tax=Streptosporangium sp. NPDC000396 TaxID=3366185 RepID=UPI003689F38D